MKPSPSQLVHDIKKKIKKAKMHNQHSVAVDISILKYLADTLKYYEDKEKHA